MKKKGKTFNPTSRRGRRPRLRAGSYARPRQQPRVVLEGEHRREVGGRRQHHPPEGGGVLPQPAVATGHLPQPVATSYPVGGHACFCCSSSSSRSSSSCCCCSGWVPPHQTGSCLLHRRRRRGRRLGPRVIQGGRFIPSAHIPLSPSYYTVPLCDEHHDLIPPLSRATAAEARGRFRPAGRGPAGWGGMGGE